MVYTIILIIGLLILFLIYKVIKTSPGNPRGFAKSIAKTQLNSLSAIKGKYPNLSKEEQYYNAMITRPGYTEETIKGIIKNAKETAEEEGYSLKFKDVVKQLVMVEYLRRTRNTTRDFSGGLEMMEAVSSVIPDDL